MKRTTIKPIFVSSILLLFILALAACGGSSTGSDGNGSGTKTIKMSIGAGHTPESTPWIRMVRDYYIPEVNKALENTDYEIAWTESYGGTVAKLGEVLGSVESGILDMGFIVVPFEPVKLKLSNVSYNTPFSTMDTSITYKVAKELIEKYPEYHEEYENVNQQLLAVGFGESYELVTNFPVEKVADLKGKKIAAAGKNLEWIEPVGAVPVQGGLNEAYSGVQSGVMDGWILDSGMTKGVKLHEQAKYFTKVGFGSVIIGALTINNNKWEKLPEEVQQILLEVGTNFEIEQAEVVKVEEENNIKEMEELGAIISEFPEKERKEWMDMLPNLPNEYAKTLNKEGLPGTEFMKDYIQGQEKEGYKFPLTYEIE